MLAKINRQTALETYPRLPLRHYDKVKEEYVFSYPEYFAYYILTLPSKSYKGHVKMLAQELIKLMSGLGCNHLIFLGDEDTPWLQRLNAYDTFQESLQYLMDNKIGKRFNGALKVDISALPIFIKNLVWLVRTNGVLPYVNFVDPDQKIIADICQYGNLHISTRDEEADKQLKDAIAKTNFEFSDLEHCNFSYSKKAKTIHNILS